jgi:tetratricopeptide (TPR) repeat protein/DNA-binding XRE family transcriptional regulator
MTVSSDGFNIHVRRRREQLGLSRRALAQRANCAEVTLLKIERGERVPTQALAAAIVSALELDPDGVRAMLATLPRPVSDADAMPMPARVERYLALAEIVYTDYDTPRRSQTINMLSDELDVLRATIEWLLRNNDVPGAQLMMGKLAAFWDISKRRATAVNLYKQALLLDAAASQARAYALYGHGRCLFESGDIEAAHTQQRAALDLCRRHGLDALQPRVLNYLARMAFEYRRDIELARDYLHEALDGYRRLAQPERVCAMLAEFAQYIFPDAEALTMAERANTLAAQTSSPRLYALAAHSFGKVLVQFERFADAMPHFERAINAYPESNSPDDRAWPLLSLAYAQLKLGDIESAQTAREQALTIFQSNNHFQGICLVTHGLGQIARMRGDALSARRYFLTSYRGAQQIGNDGVLLISAVDLVRYALDDRQFTLAVALIALGAREIAARPQPMFDEYRQELATCRTRAIDALGADAFERLLRTASNTPPDVGAMAGEDGGPRTAFSV